jgi:transcriptional regulator with XRE-family HTH domain
MSTASEVAEFESRLHQQGIRIADVLKAAGVDRSMWTRWKNGTTTPRLDNWRAVERAAHDLAAAKPNEAAA